ncbi:MAG: 2-hydroxyacyl-CoA dehydratase family protein [Oscillospiraceae bacterium]
MTDDLRRQAVLDGNLSIINYICQVSAAEPETPDSPGDLCYWQAVNNAHKNGKKLIFTNGPVPLEILYALDCVPLCLDLIPSRLSRDEALTSKLINEAETHANSSLCSLNKTNTGILLSGILGLKPDAYVTVPIACESARAACPEIGRYLDAPSLHFDIPLRRDASSSRYIGMQFDYFIGFMEEIAGKKLDWDKVKYCMGLYNRSAVLLKECAELRRSHPCPLSSHEALWNELMNAFGPTEEMVKLLETEISLLKERIDSGAGPCPNGEKHRVLLLHNLIRQGSKITAMLEENFGAVTVADGFCFAPRELFTEPENRQACLDLMCRRIQSGSMAHGAGVSGEELLASISDLLREYEPDVFIFLGNRGCKHAWASTKMVSDVVLERYAIPMLTLDVDNTDFRYKSEKEINDLIAEYMDTVVNKK